MTTKMTESTHIQPARIPIADVANRYGVTVKTVRNWISRSGQHRLKALKIGGKIFTTEEWLAEFEQPVGEDQQNAGGQSQSALDRFRAAA